MSEQTLSQPCFVNESDEFTKRERGGYQLPISPTDIASRGLLRLWQDLDLGAIPLIFLGTKFGYHRHHQPFFLDQALESGQTLTGWQRLSPPQRAYGIAEVALAGPLRKADFLGEACLLDRETVTGPLAGWYRYDFLEGWSALSVMLSPDQDGDAVTISAIPQGRQDAWLSFLHALGALHQQRLHAQRRGLIEIVGEREEIACAIQTTSFDEVILPKEVLRQVAAQRRIFSPDLLARYASFHIPRMRKVLLAGPPGTGKTTLLKAEAALHARNGGYVAYVFAARKANRSWEVLSQVMESAAQSQLPTLILVEDFEQFVSAAEDFQQVLNTLDGVATPDNPAGTLLLATTNAPEHIDPRIKDRPGRIDTVIEVGLVECEEMVVRFLQRFLGVAYSESEHEPLAREFLRQTGSHLREVCLLGMIHALEKNREQVVSEDLLWAHETILHGRMVAAQPERFAPPPPHKRAGMGFDKRTRPKGS